MEHLPQDPFMLMSYVNTQLRDCYPSLQELCKSLDIIPDDLCSKLAQAGFEYNAEQNKFW